MAAVDELEGYVSSLEHSLKEINEKSNVQPLDAPLPEDAAWADSLLIEDPETSGNIWNDWNSFNDALFKTLNAERASLAAMQNDDPTLDDIQIPPRRKSPVSPKSLSTRLDDAFLAFSEADGDSKKLLSDENTDILWSKEKLESAFRPTYSEDLKPSGAALTEDDDLFLSSLVVDQPVDGIFQVWDLGFPAEEDEWITQLNKALDESSLETSPLVSASNVSKDLTDIKMEEIISGMEELSLNRFL